MSTGAPADPDEVTRLEAELDRMRAALDRRRAWRTGGRRAALTALLVLGCGFAALALIAGYVRATVVDTDRYVDTMAPIAQSPSVQRAVADRLDDAIDRRVDLDGLLSGALPERAAPFAPALARTLGDAIRARIDAFVASDAFEQLWTEANRRAHTRVVALLTTGGSGRLGLEDDTVYLDLGGAVERVRQGLDERGLERVAAAIPPSVDGRVTLLRSEAFVTARRGLDLLERLTLVLPLLSLACLAGHVWLSRPRRRGLLRVGLGLLVTALLLLALVGLARTAYLDAIDREVLPREAAADIFDTLLGLLRTGLRAVVVAALVLTLLALVLGRAGALADRSRATFRRVPFGWVADHRTLLQGGAVALGGVVLFLWDPPTAGLVAIDAALVVLAVLTIAALGRAGSTARSA